jgi:hypothetical protein
MLAALVAGRQTWGGDERGRPRLRWLGYIKFDLRNTGIKIWRTKNSGWYRVGLSRKGNHDQCVALKKEVPAAAKSFQAPNSGAASPFPGQCCHLVVQR